MLRRVRAQEAPGHHRRGPAELRGQISLTNALKFWCVYSYLVVYDPESRPLTIVAVLHGARDVGELLKVSNDRKFTAPTPALISREHDLRFPPKCEGAHQKTLSEQY